MRLLLVVPWWRDCQAFTDEEGRELEAEYLEDMPDLVARRDRAAASLGLGLPGQAEALARLREVATRCGEDFVLGKEYLSLTWPGLNQGKMPPANAKCARASMPKVQNEGVGGELGRKTKKWRLLMRNAYWVDAGNK
ncbi:hypothetical protein [Streptomyces sp. NPDC058476]|uniref:hypothetical protein n=1 Tax=Streptomyces sp. NPDC058476 TaxID=3346519 RepID=UPI00365E51A8